MNTSTNLTVSKGRSAWLRRVIIFSVVLAMVPLFFASRAAFMALALHQDYSKKQIGRASYRNEPVEIISISVGDKKQHAINETFEKETDWLKDFSVRIKNKSEKRIVFFSWGLEFPETEATGNRMIYMLYYGVSPYRKPKDYENEGPIPAGETFELAIDQKKYERLKAFVGTRHWLDGLTRAEIRILSIHYDDDTGWSAGSSTKRDPNNPKRFISVTPDNPGGNRDE